MNRIALNSPLEEETARRLRVGDNVLITGTLIAARDAAHMRLLALLNENKPLPIDLRNGIIYYVGPTPPKPGAVIGSAGPTTAYRMDSFSPALMERAGLRGMIGKGDRSRPVIESMMRTGSVYFAAFGGTSALIARTIVGAEVVCYEDLGTEAIRRLQVVDFPCIVAIDSLGNSLYTRRDAGNGNPLKK